MHWEKFKKMDAPAANCFYVLTMQSQARKPGKLDPVWIWALSLSPHTLHTLEGRHPSCDPVSVGFRNHWADWQYKYFRSLFIIIAVPSLSYIKYCRRMWGLTHAPVVTLVTYWSGCFLSLVSHEAVTTLIIRNIDTWYWYPYNFQWNQSSSILSIVM